MKILQAAAAFFVLLSSNSLWAGASVNTLLQTYQWKNRVLLVLADSEKNPTWVKQKKLIDASQAEFHDRDLMVIKEFVVDGELHLAYSAKDPFTVILIGKDGGEKARRTQVFTTDELFKIIDSMPMRKDEKSPKSRS